MRKLFTCLAAASLCAILSVTASAQFTYFYPASGSTVSFVPTSIAGLNPWYKADAGVFKDAGVTPAGNGDTVQQWNDQSGNANNLSQATGGSRPAFNTAIIGSMPVVRCNGSAAFMTGPNIWPTGNTASYTLITVSVQRGSSAGNVISGATQHATFYNSTNFLNVFEGAFQLISGTSTGTGVTAFNILGETSRTNTGTAKTIAINLTTNGSYYSGITTTNVSDTDTGLQLCAFGSSNFNNGDVAEVLLYNHLLTLTDTNSIITYVNGRWGTSIPTWPLTKNIVTDGDSITAGYPNGAGVYSQLLQAHEATFVTNVGSQGAYMADLDSNGAAVVDPLYDGNAAKNIVTVFAGTNDIAVAGASAATTYAHFQNYCADRHTKGSKVVVIPMMSRGAGVEATRTAYNASLASDTCADAIVPTSCSSALWAAGANGNTTNFPDGVHPSPAMQAVLAGCVETAVDSL